MGRVQGHSGQREPSRLDQLDEPLEVVFLGVDRRQAAEFQRHRFLFTYHRCDEPNAAYFSKSRMLTILLRYARQGRALKVPFMDRSCVAVVITDLIFPEICALLDSADGMSGTQWRQSAGQKHSNREHDQIDVSVMLPFPNFNRMLIETQAALVAERNHQSSRHSAQVSGAPFATCLTKVLNPDFPTAAMSHGISRYRKRVPNGHGNGEEAKRSCERGSQGCVCHFAQLVAMLF